MLNHMTFADKVKRLADLVEQSKGIEQEMELLKKSLYPEMQDMAESKIRQGKVSIYLRHQTRWIYTDRVQNLQRQVKLEQQREQEDGSAKKVESSILVAGLYNTKGRKS